MPSFHRRSRCRPNGVVLVGAAGIFWGTAPVAFDLIHDRTALTPIAVSAQRLAIAAVVLVLVAASMGLVRSVAQAVRSRPAAIVAIGAGVAGYQALWFGAILYIGAGIATVVSLGLAPVLVTGWENWRARTRPSMLQSLVVIAAVSGLALVSLSSGDAQKVSGSAVFGLLMATVSGLLYAVVTVLSQSIARDVTPLALTTATTTAGAGILLPLAVVAGPVLTADSFSLLALVYLGTVTMAVGYLLLFAGLSTASASAAAVATLIEPVTATALAVVLLGDRLTALAITGIVSILASVAMLQVGHQPTAARSSRASVDRRTQGMTGPEQDGPTVGEPA